MPGVLMLETMVQAARQLVAKDDGPPAVLADVRNIRYGNMVRPGQSLRVEVTLRGGSDGRWDFAGVGTVDGQIAVQGRFSLARWTGDGSIA